MEQKQYNAFEHASHNLKAHEYIKKSEDFSDWQITTAFYCSLKFLEGSLFPNNYYIPSKEEEKDLKEFKNFNEYKHLFNKFCSGTPHDVMKRFVRFNTNEDISSSYIDLYDICHTSRYKNYRIEKDALEMALNSLQCIKEYCIENLK